MHRIPRGGDPFWHDCQYIRVLTRCPLQGVKQSWSGPWLWTKFDQRWAISPRPADGLRKIVMNWSPNRPCDVEHPGGNDVRSKPMKRHMRMGCCCSVMTVPRLFRYEPAAERPGGRHRRYLLLSRPTCRLTASACRGMQANFHLVRLHAARILAPPRRAAPEAALFRPPNRAPVVAPAFEGI